jgi:hypothetical protein
MDSMTKPASLLLVTALGLLAPGAMAWQDRASEALLGVLRRDGMVTPFAAYDGRRWESAWPSELRNLEIPISLDDVPERWWGIDAPPRTMTIWRDARRTGTVTLTGLTTIRPMCEPRIALRSDYKPSEPVPPPFERPYPKDGLLVAGDLTLEAIRVVPRDSPESKAAATLITSEFNRQETAASRAFTSWVHPFPEQQRRARPVTVEAMYAAPTADAAWTAYYVEAIREYPPGPQERDGCGLVTFASGWILSHPKNSAKVRLSSTITYCDRKDVSYMLPFGMIRANGRHFWVYQASGFDEEWYEIAEPAERGVEGHVAYRAGACTI